MKRTIQSAVASTFLVAGLQATVITHTELGYVGTNGNTQTKTFNLDSKIKKDWSKQELALVLDAQYAEDQNIEIKNKYFFELTYGYKLNETLSFNYLSGYKSDQFSAFKSQFYTGLGLNYKAFSIEKHTLNLKSNILYSIDESRTSPSVTNNYSAYRIKGIYSWEIFENLKFDQELSYRGSFEESSNYFVYSKSAFTSKLSDLFSAGISYKIDYVNDAGNKNNKDTTLTANLIIDY